MTTIHISEPEIKKQYYYNPVYSLTFGKHFYQIFDINEQFVVQVDSSFQARAIVMEFNRLLAQIGV